MSLREKKMKPEGAETELEMIKDIEYLERLIGQGYTIQGPRQDPPRDSVAFKAFLRKGHEFAPEEWLSSHGYQFVEPSAFTKGFRLAYKLIEGFPDERYRSKYSLSKEGRNTPLYLKMKVEGSR